MKKNLQRFGASVLAAAMVAQSVALPAAAETTKIDSSAARLLQLAQQARPALCSPCPSSPAPQT